MKLAYVITRSEPMGGAQVHVRDLSLAFRAQGHEVTVFTGDAGHFTSDLSEHGVPWAIVPHLQTRINLLHDLRAVKELKIALERVEPDLISAHSSKAGIVARLAGRMLKVPVIFTAHGWAFTTGTAPASAALYRTIERLAAPLAARIITVSQFDRDLAVRRGVCPPDRVVAVHNGMPDIPADQLAAPDRSPPRLIMVARFEPQKDQTSLLEALAGLTDLGWSLDLVGDGPLLPAARAQVERLGLVERVRFLGPRRDVARLLAGSQIFVLTTRWEGLPRSILEAMRAGLPVVASDVGGVHECVSDGTTGFVTPRGGVDAVRDRLRRLLGDPALRRTMGERSRQTYERSFRLEHTVAHTLGVYCQVVPQERQTTRPIPVEAL
ncbi:MAG: glycosyltransferase family 4 protein [Gemmatimonadales bacterium]|nr:glycosyltransferase family 4 protein [Gemmatimonadales bacterium]